MRKLSKILSKVSLKASLVGKSLLREINSIRSGSKISRLFRHVFESKNIKKVLGTNLAVLTFLGSFVPAKIDTTSLETPVIYEISSPIVTDTKNIVQYPTSKFYISQGYSIFHPGIDLAAEYGSEVNPIKDGVVEDIYKTGSLNYGYGNAVVIDHGNGISSLYAHLSQIEVNKGDKVNVFTEIGKVGKTGHATGPHIHLEVKNHEIPINPFAILPTLASIRI